MTINMKYGIGQKVWVNTFYNWDCDFDTVECEIFCIKIFCESDIMYVFMPNEYCRTAPECRVYATREEALANREKDRIEIDYDYNKANQK